MNADAKHSALVELLPVLRHKRQAPGMYYPINDNMFGLTEEQKKLRQLVFDNAQKKIIRSTDEGDEESDDEDSPDEKSEFRKEVGKLGLSGVAVKKEYGGRGGSYLDQVIVLEEWSRGVRASISSVLDYGNHLSHCVYAIYRFGTEKQKRKYLPMLCSGEHIGSMVVSDFMGDEKSTEIKAEKQGDYYVINGTGYSQGTDVNILIVYPRTNRYNDTIHTALIVDTGIEGCDTSESKTKHKYGFKNCRVPVANVLGEKNNGTEVFMDVLDLECVILAGGPVGLMQALCDVAFEYAHTNNQFAESKVKITDMYTKLCTSRNYLYTVARACDNGRISRKDNKAAYLHCTKNAMELIKDANEILDGNFNKGTLRLLGDILIYQMSAGSRDGARENISTMISFEYCP